MDEQRDVEIHCMQAKGLTYFLPHVITVEQLAGIEIVHITLPLTPFSELLPDVLSGVGGDGIVQVAPCLPEGLSARL